MTWSPRWICLERGDRAGNTIFYDDTYNMLLIVLLLPERERAMIEATEHEASIAVIDLISSDVVRKRRFLVMKDAVVVMARSGPPACHVLDRNDANWIMGNVNIEYASVMETIAHSDILPPKLCQFAERYAAGIR